MKNYFDFMMYLAFEVILIYEDKRSLTLSQLHDYRLKLCEKHMEYHSRFREYDDVEFEERLKSFHRLNTDMISLEERQNFRDFISNYGDLFYYVDGQIHLKSDISFF